MEERIKDLVETLDLKRSCGKYQLPRRDKRDSVQLIRYADDFVILHKDITVVQRCQQTIAEWLAGMGLELKPSKTRLTHTLHKYEDNEQIIEEPDEVESLMSGFGDERFS
ncbi:reverse transcriptase domain-containing protein [Nostoc sp.]|uniref:reverse transcriptase domain-containing protein n=1 Tax=Nostoc sp. TaxID=1180 RepID=UPI002FF57D17